MKVIASLARIGLLVYLGLMAFGQFFCDPMIYPKPPPSYASLPGLVTITTKDRLQLAGDWRLNPKAKLTVLYAHGNGEDLGLDQERLNFIYSLGFNVLAYDFRGYGLSQGTPNEAGLLMDIQSAYHYLTEIQHIEPQNIIVWGRSLGSGSATFLASHQRVGGLILESAYTSLFKIPLPWLWFPNDKFPSIKWISGIHCPVLIIHGTEDETIPFKMGQQLFAEAPPPKKFLWVQGAGHNNVLEMAGDGYTKTVKDFAALIISARVSESAFPESFNPKSEVARSKLSQGLGQKRIRPPDSITF